MNEEIKEILDFKEDADYKRLSVDEITMLRDCITDLQQENERLNKRVKECEEAYLRTRQQYSELENKYLTDEYIINKLENSIVGKIKILYQVKGQSRPIQELYLLLEELRELKGDSSNE